MGEANGESDHPARELDEEFGDDAEVTEVTDRDVERVKAHKRVEERDARSLWRRARKHLADASTPCVLCLGFLAAACVASLLALAFVSREQALTTAHKIRLGLHLGR